MTKGSLMKIESIAECSPWSILQYFWPALSDNMYWKPFMVFYLSGHLSQVLLYFSPKKYVVGIQKNRLTETILLSTQNICLNKWIRK